MGLELSQVLSRKIPSISKFCWGDGSGIGGHKSKAALRG